MAQPQDRDYDEQLLWRMVDTACTAIINRQDIYDLESTPGRSLYQNIRGRWQRVYFRKCISRILE